MAYLYNIISCDTQEVSIGYSNSNGSVTIGRAYKINGQCWLVQSFAGTGDSALTLPLDNAPSFIDCFTCYNSTISSPPSPPPTIYVYTIRQCGNTNSAANVQAFRNISDLVQGNSIKDSSGVCWEVLASNGPSTTVPQGSINISTFTKFLDCTQCNNTSTGGGGGTTTTSSTVYLYKVRPCGTQSSAAITDAYRSTTDLFPGYSVKSQNTCFEVLDTPGYPISVSNTQIPAGALDVRASQAYSNCSACQSSSTSTGTSTGTGQRIQMVLRNCSAGGTQVLQAFKTMDSTFTFGSAIYMPTVGPVNGDVYKIGNQCYYVESALWIQGATGNGTDVTNLSTWIGCASCTASIPYNNLNNLGNIGTSGTAIQYSTGYMCTNQGCVVQLYNAAAGQEPQYYTLLQCQAGCQGLGANGTIGSNLSIGYICTGNGCAEIYYDPNTGQEAYSTLVACQSACLGGPMPPGGPNTSGPNTLNPDGTPIQTTYPAVQPPSGPTGFGDDSNPYNPPPPPPPPNPLDPCDPAYEPQEGQVVRTVTPTVVGGREVSSPGNSLDPEAYEYLIPECWRWKYKLCARRPTNSVIGTPWQMYICIKNLNEAPDWPYPMPGTFIRFECKPKQDVESNPNAPRYEKYAVYHDGYGGSYSMFIESNSVFCGYTPTAGCPSSGILIKTYCVGVDQYGQFHDGKCGTYTEKIAINSKLCGYKDPPPPPPPAGDDISTEEIPTVTQVNTTKNGSKVNVGVYVPISVTDKLNTVDITSNALWTGNDSYIRSQHTSSLADSSSLNYILSVYDKPMTSPTCSSEIQYKIIYADYEGKGAKDLGGLDNETLTKAMYSQYAQILLPHGQTKFNFNGVDEDYVYIIDISRSRFKQSLDPGNWQLTLGASNFSFDFNKDSILSDMFTASYGNDSLTLIDDATKVNDNTGPIYITSKTYDVKIGTIEDGLYTTYVTASAASASIARQDVTHVTFPSSPLSNTAIVRGQERIPFVWSNFTSSITASRLYANYYNPAEGVSFFVEDKLTPNRVFNPNFPYEADNRVYKGSWTGSFTMPLGYGTFTPTIMSGAFFPEFDNTVANPTVMYDGYTWIAMNVKYTTGSKVYNGYLKFALYDVQNQIGAPGYFEPLYCPTCTEPSWSAIPGQDPITASLSQAAFGEFRADSWYNLKDELISTSSYTILSNGNILYPITSDSFGKVYPNHGIIVLSGRKLDALGFSTNRSIDRNGYNTYRLFHSMNLVLNQKLTDSSGDPLGFYGRSVDIKHTTRCFITLKNGYLNYSNNPTYVTGSEGDISNPFLYSEKSYFTSIGLYNADKELLAIGKISKPLISSTTDESLFTVKVTY